MSHVLWKWLVLLGIILITGLSFLLSRRKTTHVRAWLVSSVFSILCVLAVGGIWHRAIKAPYDLNICTPITSQAALEDYLNNYSRPGQPAPVLIPTGLFIQSVEFVTANDAVVSGYVWQNFQEDLPTHIERGFSFPEGTSTEIEEAYRVTHEGFETVGWHFITTMREQYYYDQYPFDRQDFWLRLWPNDFEHNVILIPDLDSYETLTPEELPGLETYFVLENWQIVHSYFCFCINENNTNFGIPSNFNQDNFPELDFTIGITRNTLNAMLTYVAPTLVTALMIFGILIITSSRPEKFDLLGWTASTSLSFCAGLLFVIVYAQIAMRSQLNAPGVIYLEYLYFITYIAILLVSLDSVLFIYTDKFWLVQYEDNLIPKILYWPLMTGSFLLITLFTFL